MEKFNKVTKRVDTSEVLTINRNKVGMKAGTEQLPISISSSSDDELPNSISRPKNSRKFSGAIKIGRQVEVKKKRRPKSPKDLKKEENIAMFTRNKRLLVSSTSLGADTEEQLGVVGLIRLHHK